MNNIEIDALKETHARLIRIREGAVGMDLKRINHQIYKIEHTLDHIPRPGNHPHCRCALPSKQDEHKEQPSQMAAEIIRDIQNRNYGDAETKAKALMGRLMRDALAERVRDAEIQKMLDVTRGAFQRARAYYGS